MAEALHPYPADLVITTKCGIAKVGPGIMYRDGRAKAIRTVCEASLRQLRLERIDLLQLHWIDEDTPIEESVGAMADLVREGKVRHIGISNVDLDQFERACRTTPIASVQNRYSLADRTHDELVDRCAEAGVTFFPYGPLDAKPFEQAAPLAGTDGRLLLPPPHAAAPRPSWRWLGCWRAARSSCRSPGRRRWRISRRTWAPPISSLTAEEVATLAG